MISLKLANNGCYSSKSANNMQFLRQSKSTMPSLAWKPWDPPKCNFLLGWSYNIVFGWRIGLKGEDGKIVPIASYVTKCKNPLLISFTSVGLPCKFGPH
jgi:hypothetical protein